MLSLAVLSASGQTQCVETNGYKVVFPPNTDGGLDVLDSQNNIVLADDFPCTSDWSRLGHSHLGFVVRQRPWHDHQFLAGHLQRCPGRHQFLQRPNHPQPSRYSALAAVVWAGTVCGVDLGNGELNHFMTRAHAVLSAADTQAYYYCFYPTNAFVQQGTAASPTNYWLVAYTQVAGWSLSPLLTYGWKTTLTPYNDGAVWGHYLATSGQPIGDWQTITNSQTRTADQSRLRAHDPDQHAAHLCGEHRSNMSSGQICSAVWMSGTTGRGCWPMISFATNTGPISDIHLWGSWNTNQVATNSLTFWLAIYDNVPVSATNSFSRPGSLLWQEKFAPGQYLEAPWAPGQEGFLDPGPPQTIGSDSEAWYYCFYPTNVFTQQGTAAAPKIYWLMAYAQSPSGNTFQFGWKTTTNVQNDVSVHAPWPGSPPPGNPGWQPTLTGSDRRCFGSGLQDFDGDSSATGLRGKRL